MLTSPWKTYTQKFNSTHSFAHYIIRHLQNNYKNILNRWKIDRLFYNGMSIDQIRLLYLYAYMANIWISKYEKNLNIIYLSNVQHHWISINIMLYICINYYYTPKLSQIVLHFFNIIIIFSFFSIIF